MNGASVLVMARAPRAAKAWGGLEPLLGAEGCARLQAVLIARAAAWAASVAPDAAHVALEEADSLAEVEPLLPRGVDLFGQEGGEPRERAIAAAERALAGARGPLLVAGVSVPALAAGHAAAALGDLESGCDATIGPSLAGGWYLLGLARPLPDLLGAAAGGRTPEEAMRLGLAAAGEAGLSVGLLRAERGLDSPQDAAAALADPLTPAEVRAALAPAAPPGA